MGPMGSIGSMSSIGSMGSMGSIGSPISSASFMNSGIWANPMSSDSQMSFSSLNIPHEYPSPYSSDSFAPDTLLSDHQASSSGQSIIS